MSFKKRKKGEKKPAARPIAQKRQPPSLFAKATSGLRNYWSQKSPVLKFLLGFAGCIVLFYIIYLSPFFVENFGKPLLAVQAKVSSFLLNLFGQGTTANNGNISSEDYSISIKNGCDGLETLAIMLSGIIVFPISFRLKWPGLLYGAIALMVLNFLRIIGLYFVGKNFSQAVFDFLHAQGGFVIFTMLGVFLWIIWANWALHQQAGQQLPPTENAG